MIPQYRLLLGAVLLLGCTERLVTPGSCPTHCPGGFPEFRDTVITAIAELDSSFTGYSSIGGATSLMLSNSDELGESDALIRFPSRGDSVLAGDSLKPFTVDSVVLTLALQQRDTTVGGLILDIYRLPATFDTLTSFDAIREEMVADNLLRSLSIPDAAREGAFNLLFEGAELGRFSYTPDDSTRLVLGIRLRSSAPTGLYLGAASSGSGTSLYRTYVQAEIADTALQSQVVQRGALFNRSVRRYPEVHDPDLLHVGGDLSARTLIRFEFPDYLRDSASIVRATLELAAESPLIGIPGDSAQLDVRSLVADFGAKSAVNPNFLASGWMYPGDQAVEVEVTGLIALWQTNGLQRQGLRVQHSLEHSSFITPAFQSTRKGSAPPRIRITYRPLGGLGGF
ncbi:MAG TPA: hypothetical protein PLL69_02315 [Gemmatimonadales bacterium]|nr:hypothetical protein [Gemmatimonadales bacterium]